MLPQRKVFQVPEILDNPVLTFQDIPIITADLSDQSSLEHLTKQAKVVLATVGPFALSGTPMVKACVATGTHYCDITGTIVHHQMLSLRSTTRDIL